MATATGTTLHERSADCCSIELSAAVEDYLKEIFAITSLGDSATTSVIAERVGVRPPTVTAMLRRLRQAGLVEQVAWGRVALTSHGKEHACGVIRRHRLLETFLHRVLGVPWDQIHDDAEVLEHHQSDRLEDL
ncbi:MAG: metal-dependent transcriptional regulator, partial [Nocardioides sp.]|nr:metal-dependent transcriptional regulator [Nocardioides sp.]